jgi:hypothetical protein
MAITTIQLPKETQKKLAGFKSVPGQTYGEVIEIFMSLIPEGDEEGKYTPEFRASLLRGLLDDRAGRYKTHDQVKRELGL